MLVRVPTQKQISNTQFIHGFLVSFSDYYPEITSFSCTKGGKN